MEFFTYFKSFKTDHLGQIFMTGILQVHDYHKVHVEIVPEGSAPNMTVRCMMGKISGTTLSQEVGQFPLATAPVIHSFEVLGPEFSVVLTGGPPNVDVAIQAWVYLN
jgi:hypothetical protein